MRRLLTAALCALAMAAAATVATVPAVGAEGDNAASASGARTYLVVLRERPLATYAGGIPGLRPTAPLGAGSLDTQTSAARAYTAYLLSRQDAVLAQLDHPRVLYSFTTALNGFAARLTPPQVKWLQANPRVVMVEPDALARLDGVQGATTAGAARSAGTLPSARQSAPVARNVVIGVVDSGIWPENPSFAGVPLERRTGTGRSLGFSGPCQPGERWTTDTCTTKVVGARYFLAGFGAGNLAAAEFASARDGSGHGSRTASIAAGNAGVAVTIGRQSLGHISGVAPAARLAVYKACWTAPDPSNDGCSTADAVKAIDSAVGDGVDVLSYSIGTSGQGADDVVELAFFNAASAGVFIAASAGNDGPRAATVSHASPWVTTVGASTGTEFRGSLRLGDGTVVTGAMLSDRRIRTAPLVSARRSSQDGVGPRRASGCFAGTLDAAAVRGAIVVCDRGTVPRVDKSAEVARAGGVAMVLANITPGDTAADVHAVPTVHLDAAAARQVKTYLRTADRPTASLVPTGAAQAAAPSVADFSARGPSPVADVLKPDVVAPGVGIVSAVAPTSNSRRLWDVHSGTSLAVPQVSGLGALLIGRHPTWSPAVVKSAISTTAAPLSGPHAAFASGSGVIVARRAADPGLAYDAGRSDWLPYLALLTGQTDDAPAPVTDGGVSDINGPSIAVGDLVAEQRVRRVVTNVSGETETYTASVRGLRGVATSVSPSSLTLSPGGSAAFTVSFATRAPARYGVFTRGELTWRGSRGHRVTSPIVVRPDYLRPPAELRITGTDGTAAVRPLAGVTGTLRTRVLGPVAATPVPVTLRPGTRGSFAGTGGTASTVVRHLDVPARTAALRVDVGARGADLDAYVYRDRQLVASADGPSGDEQITIDDPPAGHYAVYVHAPRSRTQPQTVRGTSTTWILPATATRSMSVLPRRARVTGGERFALEVEWSDLSDDKRWLAAVLYRDSGTRTYISLD